MTWEEVLASTTTATAVEPGVQYRYYGPITQSTHWDVTQANYTTSCCTSYVGEYLLSGGRYKAIKIQAFDESSSGDRCVKIVFENGREIIAVLSRRLTDELIDALDERFAAPVYGDESDTFFASDRE